MTKQNKKNRKSARSDEAEIERLRKALADFARGATHAGKDASELHTWLKMLEVWMKTNNVECPVCEKIVLQLGCLVYSLRHELDELGEFASDEAGRDGRSLPTKISRALDDEVPF
jgi:hypothetical protein